MKRLVPAVVTSVCLTALALGGCSMLSGDNPSPSDQFENVVEASDASGVYYLRIVGDELTAAVRVGDDVQVWEADGTTVQQTASGSEIGDSTIPGWSPSVPSEWAIEVGAASDTLDSLPDCDKDLTATLAPVGGDHSIASTLCLDASEQQSAEDQVPTYFYDGEIVEAGAFDLFDPADLGDVVDLGLDVIGDDEAAVVLVEVNAADGSTSVAVSGLSEATDLAGAVCQPVFSYTDAITAMSLRPFRTGCNTNEPNFNPLPQPFDADLALELWTAAGGSPEAYSRIQYWTDPVFGVPLYIISLEGQPDLRYHPDGTEFTA